MNLIKKLLQKAGYRYKKFKLRNKFIIPVLTVIALVFFLFTIFLITDQRYKNEKILLDKIDRTTFLIINSNIEYIWQYNINEVKNISNKYFEDEEIASLTIYDSTKNVIYKNDRDYGNAKTYEVIQDMKYKGDFIGSIRVVYSNAISESNIIKIRNNIILLSIFIFVIVILLMTVISYKTLNPLNALMTGVSRLKDNDFSVKVPVTSKDELGKMAEAFNFMTERIREHQENLEGLIMERTDQLQKAMQALWSEMELAKKIQTVLLPINPAMINYEISASLTPADEVGGDYYDVITVENRDWLVIGDVSGHGVPAGLIMMMVQTSIHSILNESPNMDSIRLLEVVNKTISENIRRLGESKYMTITVFAKIEEGEFVFSGLHQDILIYRCSTNSVEAIETNGMWIGLDDNIEGMNRADKVKLEVGDVMLLYTDGITEATDSKGEMFGDDSLARILNEKGSSSAMTVHDEILSTLSVYNKSDDITLLVIKRKK